MTRYVWVSLEYTMLSGRNQMQGQTLYNPIDEKCPEEQIHRHRK